MSESDKDAVRVGRDYGGAPGMPGFAESLRLLVESERYSLTDVGMMFGISRERVRQLCERFGVGADDKRQSRGGLFDCRVWDDAANRFRPIRRGIVRREAHQRAIAGRRYESRQSVEKRRAEIVALVRGLRDTLGRDPAPREIYIAMGGGDRSAGYTPWIISRWPTPGLRRTRDRLRDFRHATGTMPQPCGRPHGSLSRLVPDKAQYNPLSSSHTPDGKSE